MAQVAEKRMTASEFAQLGETNQIMELIEGEIIMTPAPTFDHQRVAMAFLFWLNASGLDGVHCIAPCDVYLDQHTVVQPDVFWVSRGNQECKLGADRRWHGAPDLAIEVVSPGTALRDRREKFRLYQKHGVREYWIADAEAKSVEVYQLAKEKFQRIGVFCADETFQSTSLAKAVDLKANFSD